MARFVVLTKDGERRIDAERLSNSRVLVVQAITDGIPAGAVLVPRRNGDDWRKTMHIAYPHGLYEALRGQTHARDTEADDLGEVLLSVQAARAVIADLVAYGHVSAVAHKELRVKLADLAARFDGARNEEKSAAGELFEDSVDLEDSRERKNPSAAAARTVAAERHLEVRLSEIRAIAPRIGTYEAILIQELSRVWWILDESVGPALAKWRTAYARGVPGEADRVRFIAWLRIAETDIRSLDAGPFYLFRNRVILDLGNIRRACREARVADVREGLARVARDLAAKQVQRDLERQIYRMSMLLSQGRLTPERSVGIEHAIRAIRKRADHHQVKELLTESLAAFQRRDMEVAKRRLKSASHIL